MVAPATTLDAGHDELIQTLLAMAEAEHRWGDSPRALHLLDEVEQIVGTLPETHRRLHAQCRRAAELTALA